MKQKTKTISLISLIFTLLAVLVLSAGLSALSLNTGTPFRENIQSNPPDRSFAALIPEDAGIFFVLNGLLTLACAALLVYVVIRLMVNINFGIVGITALVIVIFLALAYLLPETPQRQTTLPGNPPAATAEPPAALLQGEGLTEPPRILYQLLVIGIGAAGVWLLAQWVRERRAAAKSGILREAERAVDALQAGMGLRNVILRCYFQMAATLQEEQGLERPPDMTAREFEAKLAQKGYPAAPVRQLTTLFEKIRYGEKELAAQDENTALESLSAIITFARQEGENAP
ncbi:MAG TPA: DUF4129 domain-containing protein [Anaerolineales bacterium]|nr:DUF4129 domain-containing protein [Anaerolineales bacterium]